MEYIIYDLEMTNRLSEIIEIGAVKVVETENGLQEKEQFQTFIRPKADQLSSRITSLTGITNKDLANAPSFEEAVKMFRRWIGSDDYYLCSWGPEDKWALITDSTFHQTNTEWIVNHNDLQFSFSMLHESEKGFRYGLSRALEKIGAAQDGNKHRALDDAINTVKIFKTIFQQITLMKNPTSYLESKMFEPEKLVYQSKPESDQTPSPFAALSKLFN
ncbi:exonuclease domain-containing protein [Fictibacillus iocasae]|uniref:Exonuclease domain-containing protein n=1 Tax=Fictibacillus iocasae TaxID=2715437 RepID=A0ABW2NV80_9BACL